MINNVVLIGRLTKDAELRYTGSGKAVASFSLAVERSFSNQNGEKEADFINIVAWRKTAEIVSNYTRKGSLVGIKGRIQTRNYTNNNNQKVYVTEVVAEEVQLLGKKSDNEDHSDAPEGNTSKYKKNESEDPFERNEDSIDISDDDLPF